MNRGPLIRSVILNALLEARKKIDYGTTEGKLFFRYRNKELRQEMVKYRDAALLARLRSKFE